MSADAAFMPAPKDGNAFEAIKAALEMPNIKPGARLYTNGDRLAWLTRKLPGWFAFGAIERT